MYKRQGQEEPSILQAEMEEELAEEIQISVTTKEVIGKPTMGVETKLLLVPELIEAPEGKVAEDEVTEEVVDENQAHLDQPVVFRSSVHDTTGMTPANLVFGREIRLPGDLMFRSPSSEYCGYSVPRATELFLAIRKTTDVYKRQVLGGALMDIAIS